MYVLLVYTSTDVCRKLLIVGASSIFLPLNKISFRLSYFIEDLHTELLKKKTNQTDKQTNKQTNKDNKHTYKLLPLQ